MTKSNALSSKMESPLSRSRWSTLMPFFTLARMFASSISTP
jgi:hypothetical protein